MIMSKLPHVDASAKMDECSKDDQDVEELMRGEEDVELSDGPALRDAADVHEGPEDVQEAHEGEAEEYGDDDRVGGVAVGYQQDGVDAGHQTEQAVGDVEAGTEGAGLGPVGVVCEGEGDDASGDQEGADDVEEAVAAELGEVVHDGDVGAGDEQ